MSSSSLAVIMSDSVKWSTAVYPIGLTSKLACDKWMQIILRDIGLFKRRIFYQLLKHNLDKYLLGLSRN